MVETAIVLMLALIVVLGVMYFGQALYTYHAVANAARLGARYAIVHGASCTVAGCPAQASDIQTYVRSVTPMLDPNQLTVTTSWPGTGCSGSQTKGQGCLVKVQASYPFNVQIPLMPASTVNMSSTSQMVISL